MQAQQGILLELFALLLMFVFFLNWNIFIFVPVRKQTMSDC